MAVSSPVWAVNGRDSGSASCRSMPYTWSHTTPYVMLPTRYRDSVLERCNDRIRQTQSHNQPLLHGGLRLDGHYDSCFWGKHYFDGAGCCKLLGNKLLELL